MGIILQGILGPISGRVGPVVGGSWKGIGYLRTLPPSVAQPNTAAQQAQKTKMSNAVSVAKQFLAQIIKPLNDRFAVKMSGYNLWISRNSQEFATLPPAVPQNIVFSEGTLTGFDTLAGSSITPTSSVDYTWIDNSGTGTATATDEVYAAVMNNTTGAFGQDGGSVARAAGALSITMSEPVALGDKLDGYLAFRTANGFAVSNSEYIQVTAT